EELGRRPRVRDPGDRRKLDLLDHAVLVGGVDGGLGERDIDADPAIVDRLIGEPSATLPDRWPTGERVPHRAESLDVLAAILDKLRPPLLVRLGASEVPGPGRLGEVVNEVDADLVLLLPAEPLGERVE